MTSREEVAKKIRKIYEYDCYEMAIYEIDTIIGTEKSPLFSDFLNRLADLIDPVCHLVEVNDGRDVSYTCSNCGNFGSKEVQLLDSFNYCPACGARVVRDEA